MAGGPSLDAKARNGEEAVKGSVAVGVRTTIRWLLGILFIWAALSKLANTTDFMGSILAYEMPLPEITVWQQELSLVGLAAVALPWLELLCGLTLLANFWTESALAVMFLLFSVFIIATGSAWARGLDISCGCFDLSMIGISARSDTMNFLESARFAFFRNLLLTSLVGYLFVSTLRLRARAEKPA